MYLCYDSNIGLFSIAHHIVIAITAFNLFASILRAKQSNNFNIVGRVITLERAIRERSKELIPNELRRLRATTLQEAEEKITFKFFEKFLEHQILLSATVCL